MRVVIYSLRGVSAVGAGFDCGDMRRILVTFRNRLKDTLSGTYTEMLWHLLMGGRS